LNPWFKKKKRVEFSQRLALACDKAGLPAHGRQTEIAKRMKLTPKAVSKWFNGEAIPRRGKLQELAAIIGTSSSYLLGDSVADGISEGHLMRDDSFRVDVFDIQASAGQGILVRDEFIETIRSMSIQPKRLAVFGGRPADHIKMIAVNGDSMSGTFEPRDQIFVDVSIDCFDGDGIYIFVLDNDLYIKRLQKQHKN
jgi:transcriptional regulator with XRE-family HTH domain